MKIRITAWIAALACAAATGADAPHWMRPQFQPPRPQTIAIAAPARPSDSIPHRQLACLASAMWFEAGNEPRKGQVAVGEVVLARTRDPHFAPTPCGVLAQKHQFSFVHGGRIPSVPADTARDMEDLARRVVDGVERSGLRNALFFHATYVHPRWAFVRIGQIGEHIFFSGQHMS